MAGDDASSAWDAVRRRFASGEWFEATITGVNAGGMLAFVNGISAYVPLSQILSVTNVDDRGEVAIGALALTVGRTLRVRVIEVNERRNRVILSERAAAAQ